MIQQPLGRTESFNSTMNRIAYNLVDQPQHIVDRLQAGSYPFITINASTTILYRTSSNKSPFKLKKSQVYTSAYVISPTNRNSCEKFAMCLVIWMNKVDEFHYQQQPSRIAKKFRQRYPRIASALFGETDPPPVYNGETVLAQSHAKSITQRPDSLTLPGYKDHRRPRQVTI